MLYDGTQAPFITKSAEVDKVGVIGGFASVK